MSVELIKKLTDANGLPGGEAEVRNLIKEEIKDFIDEGSMITDRLGNLIVTKNAGKPGKHIGLSAHMDEVGLVVKRVSDGLITPAVFGVDARILPSKIVNVGKDKIKGIIGIKPVHLTKPDERAGAISIDALYIDIGAASKEEAEKLVNIGDFISFDSEFTQFGDGKIKAKALDDRLGCAVIIEILKSDIKTPITAIFAAQEEVGLRGSSAVSNRVNVDIYINLEGTISADMPSTEDEYDKVTTLGCGPAVSILDRTSIYMRKHIDEIIKTAEDNGIPYQYRRAGAGGTDAGSFQHAKTGTPVIGLATPCRYLHSPVSVCDIKDYENTVKLVKAYITTFGEDK
jgi:endoglucanase